MRDQIARDKIKSFDDDFRIFKGNFYCDYGFYKRLGEITEKLSALIDHLNLEWHETKIEKGFKKKRGSK